MEEQFYLIWPLLVYGMLRSGLRPPWIVFWVCVGIVASASLRTVLFFRYPTSAPEFTPNIYRIYMGSDTRADSLLAGCLAGLLVAWGLLPRSRLFRFLTSVSALASAVLLGCMFLILRHFGHPQLHCGFFSVIALMIAVILVRLVSAPSRLAFLLLENRPLVGVGRISYALYLYHIPVICWLKPVGLGWHFPAQSLLVVGLTFTAAALSWYCIERPCLQLKKRLSASGVLPPGSAGPGGRPPHQPQVAA